MGEAFYFYSYYGYDSKGVKTNWGTGICAIELPIDKEALLEDINELALEHAKSINLNAETVQLVALNEV